MAKILAKVNVTSDFRNWWEMDLSRIFPHPEKITVLGSVIDGGGLYLIYIFDNQENQPLDAGSNETRD